MPSFDSTRDGYGAEAVTVVEGRPTEHHPMLGRDELRAGDRLGRYVVLERVGSGGMGIIYSAYDPELDRSVALKLLRTDDYGGDELDGKARLLREAKAMARLSHPNVISVFDVGAMGDRIFMAMELVRGSTLRAWLKAERRSWRDVLDVFVRAGRGLAAAHRAGIVHRDFKPENVLVDEDDRVKVVDFGLARPAGVSEGWRPSSSTTLVTAAVLNCHTNTGVAVGTPTYMAPEQHVGEATSARSDQFSFCAALWVGLYRRHAFDGLDLKTLAAAKLTSTISQPEGNHGVPRWIERVLRRGLSPHAEDRWPSMRALLAALEPRVRETRRGWVARAAVAGVVLSGPVGVHQLGGYDSACARAEQHLVGTWDEARKIEGRRAFVSTGAPRAADSWDRVERSLDRYVQDWAGAHQAVCESSEAGDSEGARLDRTMECLRRRRAELEAFVSALGTPNVAVVGRAAAAAAGLGPISACENTGDESTAAVPQPSDSNQALVVAAARQQIAEAQGLERAGRYHDGVRVAEQALVRARATDYAPVLAEALTQLGSLQGKVGDYRSSEPTLENAVWLAIEARYDALAAVAAGRLVFVLGELDSRYEDALLWGRHAQAIVDRVGNDGVEQANLDSALGMTYDRGGAYERALEHNLRALEIRERVLGPDHPMTAGSVNNLGLTLERLGDFETALAHYERALEIAGTTVGSDHPWYAKTLMNLSSSMGYLGQYDRSLRFAERAVEVFETALGPSHPDVLGSVGVMGYALSAKGQHREAQAHFQRALAMSEKTFGRDHPAVARALLAMAHARLPLAQLAEARAELERAIAIRSATLGADHPEVAEAVGELGIVFDELGDYDRGLTHHRRALAIFERHFGPEHPDVAAALNVIAYAAETRKHYDEARSLRLRALEVWDRVFPPDHPETIATLVGLGMAELGRGKPSLARPVFDRVLALAERSPVDPHMIADARFGLARSLWRTSTERPRARSLALRARTQFERDGSNDERREASSWLASHRL